MREIRLSGSEGGGTESNRSSLPLSKAPALLPPATGRLRDREPAMRDRYMSEKALLATMTGEHFQPVRLHYQVFDRQALLRVFGKLRCVDRDPTRLRWVWLYDFEARDLPFRQSYAQIPRQHHPIVIGSFLPRGADEMVLDLRSWERATLALPFFDRRIPRKVAKVTEAEVVNRLFSGEESQITPDQLFDGQETPPADPEAVHRAVIELTASIQDPQERFRVASEYIAARAKRPF
jgi:hypothetical protein